MNKVTIIIVDPDESRSQNLGRQLADTNHYDEISHTRFLSAVVQQSLHQPPDCILIHDTFLNRDGFATVASLLGLAHPIAIIATSEENDAPQAVQALHNGLHDYVLLNAMDAAALKSRIQQAIDRATRYKRLNADLIVNRAENERLQHSLNTMETMLSQRNRIYSQTNDLLRQEIHARKNIEQYLQASEERYRLIIEASHEGVWMFDIDHRTIYANRQIANLLGVDPVSLLGTKLVDHVVEADKEQAANDLRDQLLGELSRTEMRFQHQSGKVLSTLVSAGELINEYGEHIGSFAMVVDITERKSVEEALRLREQAIDASNAGITIADARQPDFPLIAVNHAFEAITGYNREEVLGKNCRFLQGEDTHQPELTTLRKAIENGLPGRVTLRNYRKDGTPFWNELFIAPIYNHDGQLTHYVGVQNDISRLHDVAQQQHQKEHQLAFVRSFAAQLKQVTSFQALYEIIARDLCATILKSDTFLVCLLRPNVDNNQGHMATTQGKIAGEGIEPETLMQQVNIRHRTGPAQIRFKPEYLRQHPPTLSRCIIDLVPCLNHQPIALISVYCDEALIPEWFDAEAITLIADLLVPAFLLCR